MFWFLCLVGGGWVACWVGFVGLFVQLVVGLLLACVGVWVLCGGVVAVLFMVAVFVRMGFFFCSVFVFVFFCGFFWSLCIFFGGVVFGFCVFFYYFVFGVFL